MNINNLLTTIATCHPEYSNMTYYGAVVYLNDENASVTEAVKSLLNEYFPDHEKLPIHRREEDEIVTCGSRVIQGTPYSISKGDYSDGWCASTVVFVHLTKTNSVSGVEYIETINEQDRRQLDEFLTKEGFLGLRIAPFRISWLD